jgi:hypothetical protein
MLFRFQQKNLQFNCFFPPFVPIYIVFGSIRGLVKRCTFGDISQINQYEVKAILGQGSHGVVFLATNEEDGRPYVSRANQIRIHKKEEKKKKLNFNFRLNFFFLAPFFLLFYRLIVCEQAIKAVTYHLRKKKQQQWNRGPMAKKHDRFDPENVSFAPFFFCLNVLYFSTPFQISSCCVITINQSINQKNLVYSMASTKNRM